VSKDGERTMRCCPGVANDLSGQDLSWSLFSEAKWVHIEGYMLNVHDKDYVCDVMKMAKEAGALISFDLSSVELVLKKREEMLYLLKNYVDLVFGNKEEVRALLKLNPHEGCLKLQEFCTVSVVTLGKDGCLVGSRGQVYPVKAETVKVVDTTGAGDLFASGFLHGCIAGQPLLTCARWGHLLAGAVCEEYGAEIPPKKWQSSICWYLRMRSR
jgi:sugar/nucleoside kinase (ribokinase family)